MVIKYITTFYLIILFAKLFDLKKISEVYMVTPVNEKTLTFRGLSTDEKPTTDIVGNGSVFIEMDTSKVFLYDLDNMQWLEFSMPTKSM